MQTLFEYRSEVASTPEYRIHRPDACQTFMASVEHKEEDDDGEDDDLMSLIDDLVSIVESGNDDYISGVAFLVVSSMIDALAMQLKKTDKGGVFMEGPLIDIMNLVLLGAFLQ